MIYQCLMNSTILDISTTNSDLFSQTLDLSCLVNLAYHFTYYVYQQRPYLEAPEQCHQQSWIQDRL
ncbi:hypothetical protein FOTG_18042 [Fusarium oxysporum f. sp. vasinfectum 25433]|uniref:Uncharacterized protein n=1 Tax=Fusarium oxysporum f. sp. vasinfectum 25433 TaxID=1089449 RepID=X0KIQ3_FUSOX|nr:hypothetical protein FOTG_18042 [Fusarium oxysporum f. sp. vasinfectum 25433]